MTTLVIDEGFSEINYINFVPEFNSEQEKYLFFQYS